MDHFTSVLYNAHLGFDQRELWNVIEKKIDSWAKCNGYPKPTSLLSSLFDLVCLQVNI